MTSDQPRRRSLVDKLLHRNTSTPDTAQDSETQSTTGLIHAPPSSTRTITLPLEGGGTETLVVSAHSQTQVQSYLPVPSVSNPLPYEQIPNDQIPRDPSNSTPESWHFNRSTRKASIPASDTGENTTASSDVEKAHFASLMVRPDVSPTCVRLQSKYAHYSGWEARALQISEETGFIYCPGLLASQELPVPCAFDSGAS